MKTSVQATPNQLLRREREWRGWSRQYVAEQIGSDFNMIGRWERGNIFPSPYYRQKLCELFGKTAQDLGLMQDDTHSKIAETNTYAIKDSEMVVFSKASQPLWTIPYRRNPFFTSREEVLLHLHTILHSEVVMGFSPAQAISGLGGIGKTQVAIEYAYRYRHEYQDVLWLRADTRETLISDFGTIASLLHLSERDEQNQILVVNAVKHWLNAHTSWLLILDNVEDFDMISDFLPSGNGGHILLTTRAQSTGIIAQRIDLEKMEPEEGALFLLRRAKLVTQGTLYDHISASNYDKAIDISYIMDGLPLALDQAGAYIEETSCSLSDYLEHYQNQQIALLNTRIGPIADHPESVATTFLLSFEKVQRVNPAAAELLRFCAFLHPDAIPEEIITAGAPDLGPVLQSIGTNSCGLDIAISVLRKFSLLRRNPETKTLSIHRLVQMVLKGGMDEETQRQWAERTVRAVNCVFPVVEITTLQCYQRYVPSAQICAVLIEDWRMVSTKAAELLHRVGEYFRVHWQFATAEPLFQQALAIREQTLGAEHLAVAETLNSLGVLYHEQGKYVQAEPLYYQALVIRERTLGAEHPAVAETLNNLGASYYFQGKYTQAEPLYQRAITIRQQVLGLEHHDTAESLNDLAVLYRNQGKYAQAEPLYQQVLAIEEKAMGSEHPMLAVCLNNLAGLYNLQGKYSQAEPLFYRALAIFEQRGTPDSPDVAFVLNNLGNLYYVQGRYTQAEPLFQQALTIREKILGPNHRRVAETLNALAKLYYAQSRCRRDLNGYVQIESLLQRALFIYQKTLALEHPNVIKVLKDYVVLLLAMKRKTEAHELKARIKAIQTEQIGLIAI